jgi:hypothetical protein
MVVGRVVAASVNEDCIDSNGRVLLDKLRPAHYCGQAYSGDNKYRFVASYEVMSTQSTMALRPRALIPVSKRNLKVTTVIQPEQIKAMKKPIAADYFCNQGKPAFIDTVCDRRNCG